MSRIVMSIEENGYGQVLGEFDLSEHYHRIYNKAIDDFVQKVKEHQYVLSDVINSKDYGMFTVGIEQIAEQLKAGGNDENT